MKNRNSISTVIISILLLLLPLFSFSQAESDAAITTYWNDNVKSKTWNINYGPTLFKKLIDSKVSFLGSYSDPSWITTLSGSKVIAAGSNTYVQLNSGGFLGASSNFTYDGTFVNFYSSVAPQLRARLNGQGLVFDGTTFGSGVGFQITTQSRTVGDAINIQPGQPTTGNGGGVTIVGANGASTGNTNGGSVTLNPGNGFGTGLAGNIGFFNSSPLTYGGGSKVLYFNPAAVLPSTAVSSGGVMYVKSADNLPYWWTGTTEYPMTGGGGGGGVSTVFGRSGPSIIAQTGDYSFSQISGTVNNSQLAGGIDLTSKVANILPPGNGGTGSSTGTVSKTIGKVVNVTINASSGSLYTVANPNTTFTFTSGGLTTSGGNNDYLNYVAYNGWYTNVNNHKGGIIIAPTVDGNGAAVGLHSGNGDISAKLIMTGVNKGKVSIDTYRLGVITNRAISTTALTYTNSSSQILLTFERSESTYIGMAYVVDGSGNVTGTPVSVTYNDPYSNISGNVWQTAQPTIYHLGGNQTITPHFYQINEVSNPRILIYGNSIAAGTGSGGDQYKWTNFLKNDVPDGVVVEAGGGNQTSMFANIKPEILLINPKIAIYCDGINDVINGVSAATTQANILDFINFCLNNNIVPILCEVTPIGSSFSPPSGTNAAAQAAITALNSWMNGLSYVTVVPQNASFTLTGSLNPAFDSGDFIHLNAAGNKLYASNILNTVGINRNIIGNSTQRTVIAGNAGIDFLAGGYTNTSANKVLALDAQTASFVAQNITQTLSINNTVKFAITNSNTGSASASLIDVASDVVTSRVVSYSSTVATTGVFSSKTAGLIFLGAGVKGLVGANNATGTYTIAVGDFTQASSARAFFNSNGRLFLSGTTGGSTSANSTLQLGPGSATANTAPLQFTAGPFETTARAGVVEYDGINLAFTPSGTIRKTFSLYQVGRLTAQTAAVANVVQSTVGANDGTFLVNTNVLVTSSTTHSFTVTCTYTDESNTSRTVTLNLQNLAGTIGTSISNAGGAIPYVGIPLEIRCKAGTTITIGTTGTFTSVTYNFEGSIAQIN